MSFIIALTVGNNLDSTFYGFKFNES